jgi:hypothetical protein
MRDQRWFGAKAADLTHFGVLETVPLTGELELEIVEARFNSGVHDLYQLLVRGEDRDASPAPLVGLMAAGARTGPVHFHWTGTLDAPAPDADARPMGAEQSISTIVIDGRLAL